LDKLERFLTQGRLGGTGKLVFLPVDQGFEHGPARSFAPNPPAYDPEYHPQLAIGAGLSGYAAPLGFIESIAEKYADKLPLILKLNSHTSLYMPEDRIPAITASVEDALRLRCSAIGFTIYPGSAYERLMYEQIAKLAREAKKNGLAVIIWSYPRGKSLTKQGETALDVVAYAAHIAVQLGAHIVKVKLPSSYVELEKNKPVYENIPKETIADRVRHVIQSAFNGKRIVVFSGGPKKDEASILEEVRGIKEGGGFGSIIGRNVFQRPKQEALNLLDKIIDIYKS